MFKGNFASTIFALTLLNSSVLASAQDNGATKPKSSTSFMFFFEGNANDNDPWDKIVMRLKPECTNLPDVKSSPPAWRPWRQTVSDVRLQGGQCVRLFRELNCCGEFYDLSENSHDQLVLSDWNDKAVSFRGVPCDSPPLTHPSDCSLVKTDSFLAIFYENWRSLSGRFSFGLEVLSTCVRLPRLNKDTFRVFDIYIPEGKCIRLFDGKSCDGESFDYASNGWFLYDVDWEFRTKSFVEIACNLDSKTLPCSADIGLDAVDGSQSFSATFFEGYRSDQTLYYRNITVDVTSTCENIPTTWNQRISDMTLPEGNCICLFDRPDCGGASFHGKQTDDENNLVYNFNDKTKSFRACNAMVKSRADDLSQKKTFDSGKRHSVLDLVSEEPLADH